MSDTPEPLPPPGLGEIFRGMIELKRDLNTMRSELGQIYVRQDVWQRAEKDAGTRVGEVVHDVGQVASDLRAERAERKAEIKEITVQRDADRRLIWTAFIAPILVALVVGVFFMAVK